MSEHSSPGKATLLPCPFCGGEDIELWTGFGTQAEIGCQSCCCERSVQVADMREEGEPYPEFDNKTFRYPDWMIERTNNRLIAEWNTRVPAQAPADCGDWRDDPSSDERWNAGVDFIMCELCDFMGVDPHTVSWDAATETVEGDVHAVIGNILRAKLGEDWSPSLPSTDCGGGA